MKKDLWDILNKDFAPFNIKTKQLIPLSGDVRPSLGLYNTEKEYEKYREKILRTKLP